MSAALEPNLQLNLPQVREHLARYLGAPGQLQVCCTDDWPGLRVDTTEDGIAHAIEWVRDADAMGADGIYHRGTTVKASAPRRGRGRAEDSHAWLTVQLDVDYGKPRYAPDAATAYALVCSAPIPAPTDWVASGHGLYPVWLLDEPADDSPFLRGLVLDLHAAVTETFAEAGYLIDPGVTDAARVWRIPGTVNRKDDDAPVACLSIPKIGAGKPMKLSTLRRHVPAGAAAPMSMSSQSGAVLDLGPGLEAARSRMFTLAEAQAYVQAHALAKLSGTGEGGRNHALNAAALVVGHFVGGGFLTAAEATDLLLASCPAGWDEPEPVRRATIRSGLKAGMREPYAYTPEPEVLAPPTEAVTAPSGPPTPGSEGQVDPPAEGEQEATPAAPAPGLFDTLHAVVTAVRPPVLADLTPYLFGEVKRTPTERGAAREDGVDLLYAGKDHTAIGETEAGKSWLALTCAIRELTAGRKVLYVHFEEPDPAETVLRLRTMGVDVATHYQEGRLAFAGVDVPVDVVAMGELVDFAPDLVILDGVNAAMTLHGWDTNSADGAGLYKARLVNPFVALGAAVLSLDHVVKDTERNRSGYAMGSAMKLNMVAGASFRMENQTPLKPGAVGRTSIYVVKDRPGSLRAVSKTSEDRNALFATMEVDSTTPLSVVTLRVPQLVDEAVQEETGPSGREVKVLEVVRRLNGALGAMLPPSTSEVRRSARVQKTEVLGLLESLERRDLVFRETGKGQGTRWAPLDRRGGNTVPPGTTVQDVPEAMEMTPNPR